MKIIDRLGFRASGYGVGSLCSNQLYFSFVHKEGDVYTLLHRSYQCRMFLVDDLFSEARVLDKETRFFIHGSKEYIDNMFTNLPSLNSFEEKAGVTLTQLIRYDDGGLIVEGDALWQSNLWKISLYSLLLKCLSYSGGVPSNDARDELLYYNTVIANHGLLCSNMKNPNELTSKNYSYYEKDRQFWNSHTTAGVYEILSGGNKAQLKVMKEWVENEANI